MARSHQSILLRQGRMMMGFCNNDDKSTPTAVTFSFEIGVPCCILAQDDDVEYVVPYLPQTALKFVSGEAHDCIHLNGDPIGNPSGGNVSHVTFVNEHDVICHLTVGLSSFEQCGAFYDLTLQNRQHSKQPNVGANLVEPVWTYDRSKLGLGLWLTAIAASKDKPVARYGFTLTSDVDLSFDASEFEKFWEWLVQVKYNMVSAQHSDTNIDSIRARMQSLHDFLIQSFSSTQHSDEHYLYGTSRSVSLVSGPFSIYIYRIPGGETFQSTVFVHGKQYDTRERSRIEQLILTKNDLLAYAISVGLQDTDLLYQMGLIVLDQEETVEEVELLPLHKDSVFKETRGQDMARDAVIILAAAGLRKVSIGLFLEDEDGWDIYDLAAAKACVFDKRSMQRTKIQLASVLCALIQVLVPILLIYRNSTRPQEDLTWDVYIARLFFGFYAIFYEGKTWEVNNGDRVTGWLCFLSEFSTQKLIFGMLINKVSMLVTDAAMILLMLRSYSVFDVTLNALALYFILDLDDDLVNDGDMEVLRQYQKNELIIIKSETALEYKLGQFQEEEPEYLPAHYFVVASRRFSTVAIVLLCLGCIWMIVEPFVLGWKVE